MKTPLMLPIRISPTMLQACRRAVLVIVCAALLLAVLLASSYRSTLEREKANLRNVSSAFAVRVKYAMMTMDVALSRDAERALREDSGVAPSFHLAAQEELPFRVYVVSAEGRLVAKHALRQEVRPMPNIPTGGVGKPQIDFGHPVHPGGPPTITLTRSLSTLRGTPGGSIMIEADASYFDRILNTVALPDSGSANILRTDGILMVRSPKTPDLVGRSVRDGQVFRTYLTSGPSGTLEGPSPLDGTMRIYGYANVQDYPLFVVMGIAKAEALAIWHRWVWVAIVSWILLSATLMTLAMRVGRESERLSSLVEQLTVSENRLKKSYAYLVRIADTLATPLWVLDGQRRVVLFNKAFRRFVGAPDDADLAGRPEADMLDPHGAPARGLLYDALSGDSVDIVETEIRDGAGKRRTVIQFAAHLVDEHDSRQIVSSFTDVTERKHAESRVAFLSDFDARSGLPNEAQFRRELTRRIEAAASSNATLAVLLVTLERADDVADLLGREAGNDAILDAAHRLDDIGLDGMFTARVKNNEFAVIVSPDEMPDVLEQAVRQFHSAMAAPVRIMGREFTLRPVIGVALFPQDARTDDELLRHAGNANRRANRDEADAVQFYSAAAYASLNERLSIEERLRNALAAGELSVFYQPKIDTRTLAITGLEALLRWTNRDLGSISPAQFIPIAEQTGLIDRIGTWVIAQACAHARAWEREHGISTKVAVNLSIKQFNRGDLVVSIAQALAASALRADCLELEITESIAMSRTDVVEKMLADIRELGVDISIDDFGTGYSSLSYLKRFPVQSLKVDQAFVRDLGADAGSLAIVRSIVALGHGLGMRIVAEGVETPAQLALLEQIGCDQCQGFLFSRPVPPAEVPGLFMAPSWRSNVVLTG